ncbi:T9SS C-terminal target domain-containing protein [Chryseobacterium daecheongense]|uniref:T9SS C-terminal target domain-containing protein n=2 Tax=Chryseobacterium daecheongense TaxID=192389 RepID=A0A3N0W5U7_9FLAO|nr:T9SS C-terminal target domain-containing protein [Chryseobacterium daecheongense]
MSMKTKLLFKKMKNRYLFLFLAVFSVSAVKAQVSTFPWTETFEDSSPTRPGWTQIYETNTMPWTFVSSATTGSIGITAFAGTKFANFPANSSSADKTKLVTPPLNTAGLATPKISFYLINPQQGANANWVRIYYRLSPTDPWNMLMGFQPPFSAWYFFGNIGVPPNVYQIAIECENAQGYSTLVDNFTVSNDVLSVNDVMASSGSSIKYYPNPVKNALNYTGRERINEINIYDVNGKKVQAHKVNSEKGTIDVSALNDGMYIISGTAGSGTETFKIIKN